MPDAHELMVDLPPGHRPPPAGRSSRPGTRAPRRSSAGHRARQVVDPALQGEHALQGGERDIDELGVEGVAAGVEDACDPEALRADAPVGSRRHEHEVSSQAQAELFGELSPDVGLGSGRVAQVLALRLVGVHAGDAPLLAGLHAAEEHPGGILGRGG